MYAVLIVVWPNGLIYGFIIVLKTPKALTVTTFYIQISGGLATFWQSPFWQEEKEKEEGFRFLFCLNKIWTRMTARVIKQDPNTYRVHYLLGQNNMQIFGVIRFIKVQNDTDHNS